MDINKYLNEIYPKQIEYLGTDKIINKIEPLVSVFVTTYQHESFIRQCLDGILMQKVNFSFEILLGEDESSDGTRGICKEYADKYPDKIRLFLRNRKESVLYDEKGRFIIMNSKLLRICSRGRYTAICEGDDFWLDDQKLQRQVDFLEANPDYGLVHTDIEYIDEFSNIIPPPEGLHKGIRDRIFDGYIFDYYLNNPGFILTASCMYRSELLKNLGTNEWFVFDHWFFLEISRKSKIFFIPEKLTAYRRNPNSLMISAHSFITDRTYYVLLDQIFRFYGKNTQTLGYYLHNKKVEQEILKCYIELLKKAMKGKLEDKNKILAILLRNIDFIIKLPVYVIKNFFVKIF